MDTDWTRGTVVTPPVSTSVSQRSSICSSGGSHSARVVELIRNLECEATKLRGEKEVLLSERSRWVPSTPQTAGAAVVARTPRACASSLAGIAAQESRAANARHQVQRSEREMRQFTSKREEMTRAANAAVNASEERRTRAQARLAELNAQRQMAETLHRENVAKAEAKSSKELAEIEAQIVAARSDAEARTMAMWRQAAVNRKEAAQEIESLRANCAQKIRELDRSLVEQEKACEAAIAAAEKRCQDAEDAGQAAWLTSKEVLAILDKDTEDEVAQLKLSQQNATAVLQERMAEMEASFSEELRAVASRTEALRLDRSAEERAVAVVQEVSEDVRRRIEARDLCVRQSEEEIAHYVAVTTSVGQKASMRSLSLQEAAEKEIERMLVGLEEFGQVDYTGHLEKLYAQLRQTVAGARDQLKDRQDSVAKETSRQVVEAIRAKKDAERRVESMRQDFQNLAAEKEKNFSENLHQVKRDQELAQTETTARILQAQEHKVNYMVVMQSKLQESLSAPVTFEQAASICDRPLEELAVVPPCPWADQEMQQALRQEFHKVPGP